MAIINPSAGPTRPSRWHSFLADRLERELGAEAVLTEGPGQASVLAAAARDRPVVIACGGDGTVAEVVAGMDLDRQALLILPTGSGNGLARDLGLHGLDQALTSARRGRIRRVDLMDARYRAGEGAGDRLVVSTAGFGYAAEVVRLARDRLGAWGRWRYGLAGAVRAWPQEAFALEMSLDGQPRRHVLLTNLLLNTTRHAGNFDAFPAARPDDGHLHLLAARAGFARQTLHNLSALSGAHFYASAAPIQAATVAVDLPTPRALMLDGEILNGIEWARFSVRPRSLACLA